MVCSLGSGRVAAMARVLVARSASQTIAEEVGHQKLAARYMLRELREADEANLLDEEDMHIFDSKPMTDPLHLVRCNACKKPVKASQYASHAELCKSLSSADEKLPEHDGNTTHKKPPRKDRKKLQTPYVTISVGKQERFVSVDANDIAASDPHLDEHIQMTTSFTMEAKRGEYPKGSSAVSGKTCDHDVGYQTQMPGQIHKCCLHAKDVPVPLATKMFYSQRNHRLRSALSFLYHEASTKEQHGGMLHRKVLQRDGNCLPSPQKPDQILAQSSEIYLGESGGCPPAMNFSNQFSVNNASRSQTVPVAMIRSNYLSNPYSFGGNSGKPLRTVQQQHKGNVPVT